MQVIPGVPNFEVSNYAIVSFPTWVFIYKRVCLEELCFLYNRLLSLQTHEPVNVVLHVIHLLTQSPMDLATRGGWGGETGDVSRVRLTNLSHTAESWSGGGGVRGRESLHPKLKSIKKNCI